ncbi:high frequency lysogenization protein HflD [Porticoccaceae bacterium]|nr:high frequency lysogenization protein HflD [Porticoccaceae bacterium]MDA8598183.1 high frequency lysogenization protein HflD [Porticoccaceae bacterium]MDA8878693.1 high frequency lysogenization protein HflD [Porticoccaceae bacterium]MDA8941498.1 high frequency lysogenization protein HflD [Porticoccaceae bacterium]MDB2395875.1 high frequency lysogenization protein HflD [Porticoccaceae bacterium]
MIFNRPTPDQALALAGVFQSAELVDHLARYGDITDAQLSGAMTTLLNQNPASVLDLYDSTDNLELGINSLRTMLNDRTKGSANVMRYVIGIMYLSRRLINNSEKISQVASGITQAQQQAEHFSPSHDNVIANIAGLYTETVSTMQGRIQVSGDPLYLTQAAIAQRVRCLLFSGIRSAFLWHQVGGKRSHLLLQRKGLMAVLPK